MPDRFRTNSSSAEIRLRIAREAARLLARGKVRGFHTARMRAMRWLSQGRLSSADVPTQEEVMRELEALTLNQDYQLVEPEIEAESCENISGEPEGESWGNSFRPLLEALEKFHWDADQHPESDALYHSLQVYQLGKEMHTYDEEFLWACLLHDIGYVVDPRMPTEAALRVLHGRVTERVEFLVGELPTAHAYLRGETISKTVRRDESFDELIDLARCDRAGRVAGRPTITLDDALQELEAMKTQWES